MSVPGTDARDTRAGRAGPRQWAALVTLAAAVFVVSVDATVLDLALPFISADLQPSGAQLLWIIDVYSFAVAGLLVTMGVVGDRWGRRRLLLLGALGFAAASALAAVAHTPELLILARILQGMTGATLMPSTLALIRHVFADPRERTAAIGVWGAMAGSGAAAGPLVGGWLLEHFWWGSVFLVNVPIMIALVVVAPLLIPESRDPRPGSFDLVGAGLSMVAIIPLVYAIKEATLHGPEPMHLVAAVVGVVAALAFVHRMRTARDPMLDLTLFADRRFSTAVVANFLSVFALAGVLFFGSQYLQLVLGASPLDAGLLMLPGMALSAAASLLAAWAVRVRPVHQVLSLAMIVAALGAAVLVALRVAHGETTFALGFALIGVGVGVAITLTTDLVVGAAPPDRAGAASAVSETAYELGVALGVAVLGSVVMAIYRANLGGAGVGADAHALDTLGGAVSSAGHRGGDAGAALLDAARSAFVTGTHTAAVATTVLLVLTAFVVWRGLRPTRRGLVAGPSEVTTAGECTARS